MTERIETEIKLYQINIQGESYPVRHNLEANVAISRFQLTMENLGKAQQQEVEGLSRSVLVFDNYQEILGGGHG